MVNSYPYPKESFTHYVWRQLLIVSEFLGITWMMVFAPTGAIILGIFAGFNKQPELAIYLWGGFAFCSACTIATICLILYANYRKSIDPDYDCDWCS